MQVRFWGTRGSLAKPGPTTLHYGGNTSCVEVTASDGTLVILDCGTGIHGLGQELLATGRAGRGRLLITHTHWDHIQGFPFFAPLFIPGGEWDIYAPRGIGQDLAATLSGQMEYRYFPVNLEQLGASIRYHELVEGEFNIGSVRVVTQYLNHPAVALGYRLEVDGASLVYATDHEPHTPAANVNPPQPGAIDGSVHDQDLQHVQFIAGADLLIHDSQYTEEEYQKKLGWGHSPAERVVDYALMAGVKRLALFHHDPLRDDSAVDELVARCEARAGGAFQVFGAYEGQTIELGHADAAAAMAVPRGSATTTGTQESRTILLVDDEPSVVMLLHDLLAKEGYRLLDAGDGLTALDLAYAERPDLILLDWHLPGANGVEVCRRIRHHADAAFRSTPIVLLTAMNSPEDTRLGFAAGADDYLVKPFTPAHVRSRIASWLLRKASQPST